MNIYTNRFIQLFWLALIKYKVLLKYCHAKKEQKDNAWLLFTQLKKIMNGVRNNEEKHDVLKYEDILMCVKAWII